VAEPHAARVVSCEALWPVARNNSLEIVGARAGALARAAALLRETVMAAAEVLEVAACACAPSPLSAAAVRLTDATAKRCTEILRDKDIGWVSRFRR
jgi:hypothetical protein